MAAEIFDYVEADGSDPIQGWIAGLPVQQRSKVTAKIELLRRYGDENLPGFVTPAVGSGSIKEIKIGGNIAIRLLLCLGPIVMGRDEVTGKSNPWVAPEYTLLFGAEERDNQYVPRDAVQQAERRRQAIVQNQARRVPYAHAGPEDN